jgi:DNA-binding response OmpR family regulator
MKSGAILIVDDERELREMMQRFLTEEGYAVTCAADGVEASKQILARPVDLVITDLIMPEKDGIQLMNEMRWKHPQLRIIAMSGGGHVPREQYLRIARGLGADAVLEKPFSNNTLLETVDQVMLKPV